VTQERSVVVDAINPAQANDKAIKVFGAYQITEHPDITGIKVRVVETMVEHLPMYLNLGDLGRMDTVIGHAKLTRDLETGKSRIEIVLGPEEAELMDHLVEIADLKAIGFAGIMKKQEIPRGG
jgi:hypothetical protein